MPDLPTGTVTFLFTDIEGSTALAQQFPGELPALLARHHAILHGSIARYNGVVFQIIGDSFHAAFPTAADALKAALNAQRGLRHETWNPAPIEVRMGIHTGTAQAGAIEERAGGYVGYLTLTRVQRVMSAAYGGQVLLSNPTVELVHGELPPDVTLRDMGEHRLKGLLNPEHLWQLVAPDVRQDFPPLQSLNAIPNNLPVQLTSFIGREKDIAEVRRLLSSLRLVTLTGSGGAGKTRLSLQVAAEVIDDFAQGVWFVDLAPLNDSALIPQTVASVLGLREEQGRPPMTMLADYLHAKTALIILDNCEHLIEGCAQFADMILRAAPQVKILASSREALSIGGEATYRVPSLAAPDPQHVPSLEVLTQYDAVRLFIERAKSVLPSFEVNDANAPAVAQLCYHLDGIPLALELAAARVRGLKVEQIAQRLDDRFRLLTGGGRTSLPRHQTLRATIDWSHSLLTEPESILFRRLSVFAGGWTIEAAEAVCAGDEIESSEVLDLLLHLVDKSLILLDEQSAETHYRMLETIREYAHEKLSESGEIEAVANRHLEFFANFAVGVEPRLYTFDQVAMFDRLEAEHDNFRSALEWGVQRNVEQALRLSGALGHFWHVRGYHVEGHRWLEKVLNQSQSNQFPRLRAKALCEAGMIIGFQGELQLARSLLEQSVAIWRELDDKNGLAYGLSHLAAAANWEGDFAKARALLEENIVLCREIGARWELGFAFWWHGAVAYFQKDYEAALASSKESIQLLSEVGDQNTRAAATSTLGRIASDHGDYATAVTYLEQSLDLFRQVQDKVGIAVLSTALGKNELKLGKPKLAERRFQESLILWQRSGNRENVAWNLWHLADIATATGRPIRAAQLLGATAALLELLGIQLDAADQAELEQNVVATRAQLAEATFNAAWSAGRAMTLDDAIAYALKED